MQSKTWHKHQNPKPRSIPRAKIPPPSVHTSPREDMWVTKLRQIEKGSKLARERGLTSRHFYKTLRGGLASRYCPPLFLAVPSYSTISTTQAPIPHGLSPPHTHTHTQSPATCSCAKSYGGAQQQRSTPSLSSCSWQCDLVGS